MNRIIERAREVFDSEIEGMLTVRDSLGDSFIGAVNMALEALNSGNKLVFTGIGKSGYIGKKIAATLASVGSPSIFLHPVEALHGDLGVIQRGDLLFALSYSGETDELLGVIAPAKRLGIKLVAITGMPESRLAKLSDLTVAMTVKCEACPFNLAPTTTTTSLLALGDALAMVLLEKRGFTKEDFGRYHPGGAIGRAVTMRAADIMRKDDHFAIVSGDTQVREALYRMGKARCGSATIIDGEGRPIGIFTDGDFRRAAERDIEVLKRPMREVMTPNPCSVNIDCLAAQVLKLIEDRHINDIIVVDDGGKVAGLIDVQDLPGLKLM
ncbi:MAG: KpsF/GutQ family sugar-phosphate isomerase [Victivallaceae bacterium]|nr:KpsF/GutQ family sugar-phosphate isomerase [Victivallaceae bacterium]